MRDAIRAARARTASRVGSSLTLVSFDVIIPFVSLLYRLPLITLLAALPVFTLTLFLTVTSGAGPAQPFNFIMVLLSAASVFFMFLALNPNNENAALMLWFGAGVWGAAAYLNFQMAGLPALLVGVLAATSAFWVERESRSFSFTGPGMLIGVALSLVILSNLLAQ